MASYALLYDLIREEPHDYTKLYDELERLSAHRFEQSAWFFASTDSAKEVHDHFKSFMHAKDRLWVSEFHAKECMGSKLLAGSIAWLKNNPPRS